MHTNSDQEKQTHIVSAKSAYRTEQAGKTWEQRVQAIARMNAADKLAKAAMRKFLEGEK